MHLEGRSSGAWANVPSLSPDPAREMLGLLLPLGAQDCLGLRHQLMVQRSTVPQVACLHSPRAGKMRKGANVRVVGVGEQL